MAPDLDHLKQLLSRLRDLELRARSRDDGAAPDGGRAALRDEVTRIARALRDNSYWRDAAAPAAHGERHAG